MKSRLAALALVLAIASQATAVAQPVAGRLEGAPSRAPEGSVAIPLYGAANPGRPSDEIESRFLGGETVLRNITYPTLTPVLPAPGTANGTAVIVAPGGGFMMLSVQNEGWRVAKALADRGIAAFVLKYRLNPTLPGESEWLPAVGRMMRSASDPANRGKASELLGKEAALDGLAAVKLVRGRAAEWDVNPDKVGFIGFSAGAMTGLQTVLQAGTDGDPETRSPDFLGYIYGPMTAVAVPADAPPMFAALAIDDPLFSGDGFGIVTAWREAKKPVEMHVYGRGGHGFGLGAPGTTSTMLFDQFASWMTMQGFLPKKEAK